MVLVNTLDALANPVDRLHDVDWYAAALTGLGHADIAGHLNSSDTGRLRRLREDLRGVFLAATVADAAELLNPRLSAARAVPLLVEEAGAPALAVAPEKTGYPALAARLPAALAAYIAATGLGRLGSCSADPCSCAFIDRSRAATRRYCCSWCNDRAAARAYRRRKPLTAKPSRYDKTRVGVERREATNSPS